jgi:hypothetical protein
MGGVFDVKIFRRAKMPTAAGCSYFAGSRPIPRLTRSKNRPAQTSRG